MQLILPALRALLFASALLPLLVIGGCGLKGDLVLPEQSERSSPPPESADDTGDTDSRDADGAPA